MIKSAIFIADNGAKFVFGESGSNAFYADIGKGVAVRIGTSQGFSQVGETVQTKSVGGRKIKLIGAVYGNVEQKRTEMRRVFSPFAFGDLILDNKYSIRCYVQETPSFVGDKLDGRFTMTLYAPYPFFSTVGESTYLIGSIFPAFSFPVNYSEPHIFGEKSDAKYSNIRNDGDVPVPYRLNISTNRVSTNVTVTDIQTLKFLKLNGSIEAGQTINIYRDKSGVLIAELESADGTREDIISWIDDDSQLFEIGVGDNLILANDDEGGESLTARFTFSPAVSAYYEH